LKKSTLFFQNGLPYSFPWNYFPQKLLIKFTSGTTPSGSIQKSNLPAHLTMLIALGLYLFLLIKIKMLTWRTAKEMETTTRLKNNLGHTVKFVLANSSTLAVSLLILVPTVILTNTLNKVPFFKLASYPYSLLVEIHFYCVPCLSAGTGIIIYHLSHDKLRTVLKEEISWIIVNIKTKFFNHNILNIHSVNI